MIANLKARRTRETSVSQVALALDHAFDKDTSITTEKSIILADSTEHTPTKLMETKKGEKGFEKADMVLEDKGEKSIAQEEPTDRRFIVGGLVG